MIKKTLKDIFEANRNNLICQTKRYISNKHRVNREIFNNNREYIGTYIIEANFKKAITLLEEMREAKQGVIICKFFTPHFPPILIRDARGCNLKIIRGTESFEIQYLNLIRSSLDIINIENKKNLFPNIIKKASDFIGSFPFQNLSRSQEDVKHKFQIAFEDLVLLLENAGIDNALYKLDITKNF